MPGGARALCVARGALWLRHSPDFDLRVTPFRDGLAAKYLEGKVNRRPLCRRPRMEVVAPAAPLRREPRPDAPLDTEALKGERVTIYDTNAEAGPGASLPRTIMSAGCRVLRSLRPGRRQPTKLRLCARFVFPGPSIKLPPR